MSLDELNSTSIDLRGWDWVESWTADLVMAAAAAEDPPVTVYGGLNWAMYLAVRWDNLRGLFPWQRIQVSTALLRCDENTARILISEFGGEMQFARITKFKPGQHYHVLGEKFDTFGEAKEFAERRGYGTGAPETVFVYDHIGD